MAKATLQRAGSRRTQPGKLDIVNDSGLASLMHLGAEAKQLLETAGIRNRRQLSELGSVGAYVAVKRAGQNPTLDLLYAIEGALRDIPWATLPYHLRASLTLEADAYLDAEGMR